MEDEKDSDNFAFLSVLLQAADIPDVLRLQYVFQRDHLPPTGVPGLPDQGKTFTLKDVATLFSARITQLTNECNQMERKLMASTATSTDEMAKLFAEMQQLQKQVALLQQELKERDRLDYEKRVSANEAYHGLIEALSKKTTGWTSEEVVNMARSFFNKWI